MNPDASLQLVVSACRPAVEEPLNALVVNTALQPLPQDGSGCRFIATDGTRLFDVTLDGSPACLLDVATLAAYLRMHRRFDWMIAATPSTFDACGEGLDEVLGIATGPSLLITLQFCEGGTYSGFAITGKAPQGGWQVLMPNVEQDDGRFALKLLGRLDGGADNPAMAARLKPGIREAADAWLAQGAGRHRLS